MKEPRLYVVATPIGNLEDITLRALEILATVDVVAAEDTRRTRILLSRHGLDKSLVVLQEHNEQQCAPKLVERIQQGDSIALVSDAGTPLISDPGYRLVQLSIEAGVEVVTIPGASSITAALSISGQATDRFIFEGFLPARQVARQKRLSALRNENRTMVFFESSHRVLESLADLAVVLGNDRSIAVCREMTKKFETVLRGPVVDIIDQIKSDPNQVRGEFVLVVSGSKADEDEKFVTALGMAQALKEYLPASQAARVAAKLHDVPRRELYTALEADRNSDPAL